MFMNYTIKLKNFITFKELIIYMHTINDISLYNKVATLSSSEMTGIDVYIAKTDQSNKFYIINSFSHSKENQKTFKDFFLFFNNPNHAKDMVNFLTNEQKFFIIFNYSNNINIKHIFSDDKNVYNYPKRCEILNNILVKISSFSNMPTPAIICVTELKNICLDKENDPKIIYNFENYNNYNDNNVNLVFNNIADIISLLLEQELKTSRFSILNLMYNKPIKIVLEKCRKGIYSNIPELIVDLKKAEQMCDTTDIKSLASKQVDKKRAYIKRAINILLIGATVAFLIMTFYPLFINKNIPQATPTSIGSLIYNYDSTPDTLIKIQSRPAPPEPEIDYSKVIIPANADIMYDEYIVQFNDTVSSVCKSYYNGNENLYNAIISFNNLNVSKDDRLQAGTILKMPIANVILDYLQE